VDVVEFSYFGVPATTPKEQMFSKVLDGLRGMDATIGSGTQVMPAFHLTYFSCCLGVGKYYLGSFKVKEMYESKVEIMSYVFEYIFE